MIDPQVAYKVASTQETKLTRYRQHLDTSAPAVQNGQVPVPRITRDELKADLDAGRTPIILDVRLKYPYEHSTLTLPGAIRMAPDALRPDTLDRARAIVAYDSDPDELTSAPIVAALIADGFRARALTGGLPGWIAASLPTDTKAAPHAAPAGDVPAKA